MPKLLSYLCASVCICGSIAFAQNTNFTPPTENFLNKNQLDPLKQAIAQKQYADAATRIDAMMHESADQLFAIDGGSLISVRLWIDSLPQDTRLAIMPEYDKLVGDAAKSAVEQATLRPNRRPEDLLAAGADYPLTTSNRDAIAQAAMRSLDLGDTATATLLADRAKDLGWKPSAAQQQLLDAIKPAAAGAVPLAVATPWYANDPPIAAKRVIPVIANNVIFISTERTVMAAKASGELLWKYEAPKAEPMMAAAKFGFHRPTVLCDLAGVPQVVLVRHVVAGTRFGCLRAFRAADGKLLWSSESSPALSGWSLATTPAIGGRCAWVLAVDETQRPAPLMLMGVEIMTGRLIGQTPLGNYQNAPDTGDGGADMERLWNYAGVLVEGGDVFVSAGSGMVARVDRLDGKIRWVRAYPSVPTQGDQIRELARKALGEHKSRVALKQLTDELRKLSPDNPGTKPPKPEKGEKEKGIPLPEDTAQLADMYSQQARWQTTPVAAGNVLVVAPGDSPGVFGLDRSNGSQLWDNADLPKQSLVGIAGNVAVFAGPGLTGVDVRTGKAKWTWSDAPLEGPPAVSGNVVRAWAGGKLVVINAETGVVDGLISPGTTIAPVLKNEQSKAALTGAEAISTLLAPAKAPEPKKK
jgi:outer membrane protein assembly factor BamB